MAKTVNNFSKNDVFKFTKEVGVLIKLLDGITIESDDKRRLNNIINQKSKVEEMIIYFEPTIYDEYSEKVKVLYMEMKRAKEEYNRSIEEKCFEETIYEFKKKYEMTVLEYQRGKLIRDKIKEALTNL